MTATRKTVSRVTRALSSISVYSPNGSVRAKRLRAREDRSDGWTSRPRAREKDTECDWFCLVVAGRRASSLAQFQLRQSDEMQNGTVVGVVRAAVVRIRPVDPCAGVRGEPRR